MALLESGQMDVNVRDCSETPVGHFRTTPLHLAASEGWPNIVHLLIESGADVNAANAVRWTPIHYLLITDQMTPGKLKSLKLLIDRDGNPNIRDKDGNLAVETAILYGHTDATRILLNSGVWLDSVAPIDPRLFKRDDIYRCVKIALAAGCRRVIERYDVLKYVMGKR